MTRFWQQRSKRPNLARTGQKITHSITAITSAVSLKNRDGRLCGHLLLQGMASRPDKDWSLIDCISFVVMEEEGIQEALTADQHFEQAGFTALLR